VIEGPHYKETDELPHGVIRTVEGEYYPDQATQVTKVTLEQPGHSPRFYYEHVKYYKLEEVLTMLKTVGFSIQKIAGDFAGQTFDPLTSDQMVIIATRA
jgi:hypothetical protein